MGSTRGGALQGLRVVDLTKVLAGPLCTQILSDNGAQVTKVEPPGGDETRRLGPPFVASGDAAYFSALNRGKQAISLDLSQPAAQEVLHRLLADADVLVENFLPGTMERWGLGFEQSLAERYPRLVYCAITGFGSDGPLGGLPGYDAVLQALCGVMSINGDARSGATRVGIPIVDHLTGYVALSGILMAMQARERTGKGQRVEAALYDTALSLLLPHATNWFASGQQPQLLGSAHPNIAPYEKFATKDSEIFVGIVSDQQFRKFCALLGLDELASDERFRTNAARVAHRAALRQCIEGAIADDDGGALCDALMRSGVPAGVVHAVPDALVHPHAQHRQVVVRQGDYVGVRSPMRLIGTPAEVGCTPPAFAQDSEEILACLGFDLEERVSLRQSGAAPASA